MFSRQFRFRSLILVSMGLVICSLQAGAVQTANDTKGVKSLFDPKRDATQDISNALDIAVKKNRRVLLDVGGNWCPWCKKLEHLFTENKDIARILAEKYVVVRVNVSSENENKPALSHYPMVEGYPHLFVLAKDGKLLKSQPTEELEDIDQHNATKVLAFLQKWG